MRLPRSRPSELPASRVDKTFVLQNVRNQLAECRARTSNDQNVTHYWVSKSLCSGGGSQGGA